MLESIEGIGPKRAARIMKTYGELKKIAAAEPTDMAEKCGITESAARAVRAAAKLALEDQDAKKKKFSVKPANAAALADEAFAAEGTPNYPAKP